MADVAGGGTANVTLYDEDGAQLGTPLLAAAQGVRTDLGTDGTAPPSIPGTGVRGWLRSIFDRLGNGSQRVVVDSGFIEVANDVGNPLPVDLTDRQARRMGIAHAGPLRSFHATSAGGRVLFASSTGRISLPTTAESSFSALVNPANSGVDLYVARIELGMVANAALIYARYRNVTLTSLPTTPMPSVNRGGGTNAPKGALYNSPVRSAGTGVLESTTYLANPAAYENNDVDGAIILRPGDNLLFTTQGGAGNLGGSANTSMGVVWWEATAA